MRIWSNKGHDDGSVHPIGNGGILVYERGPNIINVYGPPYSAPSYLRTSFHETDDDIRVESEREKNTAIWHHTLYINNNEVARMTDYIISEKDVFFRDIYATSPFSFKITPMGCNTFFTRDYFSYITPGTDSVVLQWPKGSTFFHGNPISDEISLFIVGTNDLVKFTEQGDEINVTVKPGKSKLLFCGGIAFPITVETAEYVLRNLEKDWVEDSRHYWHEFSSRRHDFAKMIPEDHPLRDKMLEAIDSVSVLIKCQQSKSGGVMAGHIYNMAYVRDMSGVMRGLLALGYIPEAKAILDYWVRKHGLFGNILCADGMDNDSARLPLLNDEVEITAYLIVNCFIYHKYTKDEDFLLKAFPMMEWAFEAQLKHLVEGMTEFSGDETYYAGGTLNTSIFHGSAESTLMFIEGGKQLLDLAAKHKLWDEDKLKEYGEKVAYARDNYKKNFIENGKYYANNPLRKQIAGTPRFYYSFCFVHDDNQRSPRMTWLERSPYGDYRCIGCRDKGAPVTNSRRGSLRELDANEKNERHVLNSVSLVPGYLGTDIFTDDELKDIIKPGVELYEKTGMIPANIAGTRSLGYDYGLMLYNMVKLNNPLKEKVLEKMLNLLDPTGAWVEYYDNDVPHNCRSRAWESGINIEAVIEYIKSL